MKVGISGLTSASRTNLSIVSKFCELLLIDPIDPSSTLFNLISTLAINININKTKKPISIKTKSLVMLNISRISILLPDNLLFYCCIT